MGTQGPERRGAKDLRTRGPKDRGAKDRGAKDPRTRGPKDRGPKDLRTGDPRSRDPRTRARDNDCTREIAASVDSISRTTRGNFSDVHCQNFMVNVYRQGNP